MINIKIPRSEKYFNSAGKFETKSLKQQVDHFAPFKSHSWRIHFEVDFEEGFKSKRRSRASHQLRYNASAALQAS